MESAYRLLEQEFEALQGEIVPFIREVPVECDNDWHGALVMVARPDFKWKEPTDSQRATQIQLRRRFISIYDKIAALFAGAPDDILRGLSEAREAVLRWLDLETNWSLKPLPEENERTFLITLEPFRRQLAVLNSVSIRPVFIVPDTNSLTSAPDPTKYQSIAGTPSFIFLLLPAVLGELDKLKYQARNEKYQEKVAATIRRVKGWRDQGRLLDGVTVNKRITVRAIAQEPRFNHALPWLDPENVDDRIIASVFEVQRLQPSSLVVLVTGDINLQTKAEAAGIPWAEVPS